MSIGNLITGYGRVAKSLLEQEKEKLKKKGVTLPVAPAPVPKKREAQTLAPRTPQTPQPAPKPVAPAPVPKKQEAQTLTPREPQPSLPKPTPSGLNPWEKIGFIKDNWVKITDNLQNRTFEINTKENLQIRQQRIVEDIKTTRDFDYIREDLANMKFDNEEQRHEFMKPFLRMPGLLERYVPKPKIDFFSTMDSVKDYLNLLKDGSFGTDTMEYLEGHNTRGGKLLRSIVEQVIGDDKVKDDVKQYWIDELKYEMEGGKAMEENFYNFVADSMRGDFSRSRAFFDKLDFDQKKRWVEQRTSENRLKKMYDVWKERVGFYDREPTAEELREYEAQMMEAERKHKEEFLIEKMGRPNVFLHPRDVTRLYHNPRYLDEIKQEYPEAYQYYENMYQEEKTKAYLLSVADAEFRGMQVDAMGLRNYVKKEKSDSWRITRLAKKLVQSGTFGVIKPDTIIGRSFGSTYIEDGLLKYNGFVIGEEFITREGQAHAKHSNTLTAIVGSLFPYSMVSSGIKKTVSSLAKEKSIIGRASREMLKYTKRYPVLMEVTAYNMLEEAADFIIRNATKQEYTFIDFVMGMVVGGAFGGGMEGLRLELGKLRSPKKINLQKILKEMEDVLAVTRDLATLKSLEVGGGYTLDSLFKESRLVYKEKPKVNMFDTLKRNKLQVQRPGIETPAPITRTADVGGRVDSPTRVDDGRIDYEAEGWKYTPDEADVREIRIKEAEVNMLKKDLNEINKRLEAEMDVEARKDLIEYREQMIDYVNKVNDEIALKKEYSPDDIERIQRFEAEEEMRRYVAEHQHEDIVARHAMGEEALSFVEQMIDLFNTPGFKGAMSGNKKIGEIKTGTQKSKTVQAGHKFSDTLMNIFADANNDKDSLIGVLDALGTKFRSPTIKHKIEALQSKLKKGELDGEVFEEVVLPLIRRYSDTYNIVPSKQKVDDYLGSMKERGVTRTVRKSADTDATTKKILKQERFFYKELKNPVVVENSKKKIKANEDAAYDGALKLETVDDVVTGMMLVKKYQAEGKYNRVERLLDESARKATQRGQMNQILALYSLITPEGSLRYAHKRLTDMRDTNTRAKEVANSLDKATLEIDKAIKQGANKETVESILRNHKLPMKDSLRIAEKIEKAFIKKDIKHPIKDTKSEIKNVIKDSSSMFKVLKKYELTPDLQRKFEAQANKIQRLPEGSPERIHQTKVLIRDFAEIKPVGALRKTSMYQMGSLLLNWVTLSRNILGNEIFGFQEEITTMVATAMDKARVGGARMLGIDLDRKITFGIKEQVDSFKYALGQLKTNIREVLDGVNFNVEAGKFSDGHMLSTRSLPTQGRTIRDPKNPLYYIEKGLGFGLYVPDRFSFNRAYMRDVIRSGKVEAMNKKIPKNQRNDFLQKYVSNPPEEAIKRATAKGLYNTFQDETTLSNALIGLKRLFNLKEEFGLGSAIFIFAKTPANLVNRSFAYSPLGFAKMAMPKGFLDYQRHGYSYDVGEAEMAAARALIGSSIMGASYKMADVGLITFEDDDRRVAGIESHERGGGLLLNIDATKRWIISGFDDKAAVHLPDDKYSSFRAIQPIANTMAMGAIAHKVVKNELINGKEPGVLNVLGALMSSAIETSTYLFDHDLFQGVKRLTRTNIVDGIVESFMVLPQTFVPTLLYQARKYIDNVPKETYSPNIARRALNSFLNRIPYAHRVGNMPDRRDIYGEVAELHRDSSNGLFNVFLNPVFVSKAKNDPLNNEFIRLHHEVGEVDFMPMRPGRNLTINKERYVLTAKEYDARAKTEGQLARKLQSSVINSSFYDSLTAEEQAGELRKAYRNAVNIAEGEFLFNRVKQGTIDYNALTPTFQNKHDIYQTLYEVGYGDVEKTPYNNKQVAQAVLKTRSPEIYRIGQEWGDGLGQRALGELMQGEGVSVNTTGNASKDDWVRYKQSVLLRKIPQIENSNKIIAKIKSNNTESYKIIDGVESLFQEGKISEAEKEYVLVSALSTSALRDIGLLY